MDRVAWLLGNSSPASNILEIGAGYGPIAPKSAGWRTHVVDHASREELRRKYQTANVNVDAIEEVDTIWRDGPLDAAVPAGMHGQFDTLIASHLIEHMPDLAGFLLASQRLLKPDGVINLAIPDRRYCFDYFRPMTTTGDVLDAHAARRRRHSLATAWDQLAYAVLNEGEMAWGQEPVGRLAFIDPFANAAATYAMMSQNPGTEYRDYHAWTFTPSSFSLLILELGCLGVTDWRVDTLHGPERFEFFATLRRGARQYADPDALQAARMELLQGQFRELGEQFARSAMGEASGSADLNAGTSVPRPRVRTGLGRIAAAVQKRLRRDATTKPAR